MKKALFFAALLCCTLSVTAQKQNSVTLGNGHLERKSRTIESFTKLKVSGPFNINLIEGEEAKVTIDAEGNLQELVTAEIENGTLTIAPAEGKLFRASKGNKITIKVYYTKLSEIAMLGSGNLRSSKPLNEDVKISIEGSGNAELSLECKNVQANISGSGNLTLAGTAENLKCKVSGSGDVKAERLDAQNVTAVVSGSGNAQVKSRKAFDGTISGSGNIAFSGEPAQKDLKRTGTGEFKVM
ncbi:MAG: head GIN domain-containing protein [Flavobacterium sp.]